MPFAGAASGWRCVLWVHWLGSQWRSPQAFSQGQLYMETREWHACLVLWTLPGNDFWNFSSWICSLKPSKTIKIKICPMNSCIHSCPFECLPVPGTVQGPGCRDKGTAWWRSRQMAEGQWNPCCKCSESSGVSDSAGRIRKAHHQKWHWADFWS